MLFPADPATAAPPPPDDPFSLPPSPPLNLQDYFSTCSLVRPACAGRGGTARRGVLHDCTAAPGLQAQRQ